MAPGERPGLLVVAERGVAGEEAPAVLAVWKGCVVVGVTTAVIVVTPLEVGRRGAE
jgi:hypothetical protein